MILFQFRERRRLCHSLIESSELVDKLYLQCVAAEPHSSLRHFLYVGGLLASAVSHALAEQLVATVHVSLQVVQFLIVERTCHDVAERAVTVCLHLVELHSQLLCYQSAHVRYGCEYADASGERVRLRHNPICRTAHVVGS